jgi:TolB-like protein/tetratricopeptide (TPR) repeat protein
MVAVLPFENLGAPNDEYFADGMTDELTGRLTKLPGLAVIARTSTIQYKKTTKPIKQIAKELGVDFLVAGTVRWEKTADGSGTVRVGSQVIRASDGTHVWADQIDKPYGTAIFAIQSDIAEHVARAMDVTLHPSDQRVVREVPTTNLAAYDAYLRARTLLGQDFGQNWDTQRQASESLEQAVRLDPGFAAAHALLASVYVLLSTGYDASLGTGITGERRWEMARAAADRALTVDSLSATAHGLLAAYYGTIAGDTARQRAELTLALRAEPSSPELLTALADALRLSGRKEEALRTLERALALDPRNAARWWSVAFFHLLDANVPAAKAAFDRALAIAPGEAVLYVGLAWLHLMQDRPGDARSAIREGISKAGVNTILFRMAQSSAFVEMIRILRNDLAEPVARLTLKDFGTDSIDYYEAKARAFSSDPRRSSPYFDSIATWAERRARIETRNPIFRLALAYGLAGAGRRAEAARALRAVTDSGRFDIVGGDIIKIAQVFVMIGDYDRAIEYVRRGLAKVKSYPPAFYRLDPIWDPLRERADFKKLVAQR